MKTSTLLIALLIVLVILFRLLFGIFVVKPLGTLTEGSTTVYWRAGLEMPFVASVEGILGDSDSGKALPGRAVQAGQLLTEIGDRKVLKIGYSEALYQLSLE